MRWLVCLVMTGCWGGDKQAPPIEAPLENTAAPRAKQSVWVGRYVCAQGATHVVITLDHDGSNLEGTFEFSALPENPNVPHGEYTLTGTANVAGGEVTVKLVPGEWIEHPGNYVMVGLEAHMDRERRLLTGTITNPSCTTIALARSR